MLHNVKQKNSKKMGMEAVRWQLLTIAFLSIFMVVFCMAGTAAAADLNITSNNGRVVSNSNPPEPPDPLDPSWFLFEDSELSEPPEPLPLPPFDFPPLSDPPC